MTTFHPWMYRFAFPGFAEKEWVLPRDVEHEEPWYEPLPPSMACADLRDWSLDPSLEAQLRELHEAAFGAPLFEPAGVPFHKLVDPLLEAFERGDLVAWVIRVNSVQQPALVPKLEPKPKPETKEKTWIEIVLVDQDEKPVAGEAYRLTLPDGATRSGNLDAQGFARVDGIESGPCDVRFPKIDGREWSESGPSLGGDLREAVAPFEHVASAVDCMSSVAARHGFRTWRTLYESPLNEPLRQARRDPNVLAKGDAIVVDRWERVESRKTTARHRFKTSVVPTFLRIRFERMKPTRYVLVVDGETHEREVPRDGLIEHPIRPNATGAELRVYFDEHPEPFSLAWTLELGKLCPVDKLRGVKERLNNMGFGAGREDEDDDPGTRRAVMAFQRDAGVPPTGVVDGGLREKLRETHDVA